MANSPSGGTIANVGSNAWYITIDGTAAGYTTSALEFTHGLETSADQFGQNPAPIGRRVTAQNISFNCVFNELSQTNFCRYLAGLATTSGANTYYGDQKGSQLPTYEVLLYPLHPDGHPLAGKVFTFHKCTIVPNGSLVLDPASADYEGLPVTFNVELDASQSDGQELFTIGAAVTTAPTVSSVTPTDGAASQAVDVDITVTFAIAMGKESCETVGNVIIMKSDWSAFVTPTSCSLDSTRKILTIAHADLDTSQEYVVLLTTNLRAATGVPIAANYAWDFTTTA